MDVEGVHHRTIWRGDDSAILAIDQRRLPFSFEVVSIGSTDAMVAAIADMTVRGAGLIGAAAGYGMELAAREAARSDDPAVHLRRAADALLASRPTAVNLAWAVDRQLRAIAALADPTDVAAIVACTRATADAIADEDAAACAAIGRHGLPLLAEVHERTGRPVNVLTHCNAGWLAFVDHGTATAPIYAAHDAGIPVHVWVDETRPRNQGARLTAWELGQHGVPHTLIADNVGGHLMQQGQVDLVITGTDRTSANGDVANKIGTYLKALAAHDNGVPFYVALPSSTIDWASTDGLAGTPIESRHADEVLRMEGVDDDGRVVEVRIAPEGTAAANHAFDVTPARLVTALITERGTCPATAEGIAAQYPDEVARGAAR